MPAHAPASLGKHTYHKFKRFSVHGAGADRVVREGDWVSMQVVDFYAFLEAQRAVDRGEEVTVRAVDPFPRGDGA